MWAMSNCGFCLIALDLSGTPGFQWNTAFGNPMRQRGRSWHLLLPL